MIITFIGGGSLRLLPIFRGVFEQVPEIFRDGEIRLMDRKIQRAEAVGRLVQACPEYQDIGCRVIWTDNLAEALTGTDAVYLTMGARREPTESQSVFLANANGYFSSDNLSVNGAFLSLRLGRTILGIAQAMERYCPTALMLLFPNPVSVYSHLVNTFTGIRALGICGGFINHRYDLTRLTGRDEYDEGWDVVAAGINHLSYILRGTYRGEDLFTEVMPRYLHDSWKPIDLNSPYLWARHSMTLAQNALYHTYRRYHTLIFSTEMDGLCHLFPEEAIAFQVERFGTGKDFDPEEATRQQAISVNAYFEGFSAASKAPETVDWNKPGGFYGKITSDIAIPIFRALAGTQKMRIVASHPNDGAVRDFGDQVPLEYTMDIMGTDITPVENQVIPEPFYGLTASLAEFQRLQSEAIYHWDPAIFADALDAYPIHRFTSGRKGFFRDMFALYEDLDPRMLEAVRFFE